MNNEEKILSVLKEMQNQLQTMQGDVTSLKTEVKNINERAEDTHHVVTRMELEQTPKINALYDAFSLAGDWNEQTKKRLDIIERKTEKLEINYLKLAE